MVSDIVVGVVIGLIPIRPLIGDEDEHKISIFEVAGIYIFHSIIHLRYFLKFLEKLDAEKFMSID